MSKSALQMNVEALLSTKNLPRFTFTSTELLNHGFIVTDFSYDEHKGEFISADFKHEILPCSVTLVANEFFGSHFENISWSK